MSRIPEDNVGANIVMADNESIQQKAEACGGEYYTVQYNKVENPLSMDEKKAIMERLKEYFIKLVHDRPELGETELRELLLKNMEKDGDTEMVTFINETHPTLADFIMSKSLTDKKWKIIQRLVSNIEYDRSSAPSEEDKIKAHVQLHKDVLRSCGITSLREDD